MTEISDAAHALLKRLGYQSRLPLLLALEERPRSTREVADALGVSFDTAQGQIRQLRTAGLVVVVRSEPSAEGAQTMRYVYGSRYTGWSDVISAFEAVANSAA